MTEAIAIIRVEAETRANAILQILLKKISGIILRSIASKREASNRMRQATTLKVGNHT